ncbi:hypothetical protein GCM10010924_48170 [Rhizobium wenxiniae]|uniref:PhnA-like protein n=1 Tax=Rhizobium wenxiniae TaxID=1737357 RepID=A0A7X0D268_9HYPH|nr:PhnA-like protein [Rhizobium wenxiniae]MBB6165177.1 hypothetical protein [Rhizobium wenxiniae]GGG13381.1 hypothetical protein GCM10010924_48170 [Rhizobium wenxiniae]
MTVPISAHDNDSGFGSGVALYKISWGAVLAGVAIALAAQFLLNLLGVGIGAAVLDPTTSDNPEASTFSIAGGIWFVLAGIVSAFIGGYIASRLSGRPNKSTGGFHGLTTWAVTTLVVLFMLTTSIGALIGGAFSGLSSVISGAGQSAATAVAASAPAISSANGPMAGIERQVRGSTGNDPKALQDAAVAAVQAAITGDQSAGEDARTRAADAVSRAQGIPVDQARLQVEQYEKTYHDNIEAAKKQAAEAADIAATTVATGAILGFLALALGAATSWFGGVSGTRAILRTDEKRHIAGV